jgi:hypothetical protein
VTTLSNFLVAFLLAGASWSHARHMTNGKLVVDILYMPCNTWKERSLHIFSAKMLLLRSEKSVSDLVQTLYKVVLNHLTLFRSEGVTVMLRQPPLDIHLL